MKICSIYIQGYNQFQDTFLDFTHPETGEPLDKICLIGANGTGKSTVLGMIRGLFEKSGHLMPGTKGRNIACNLLWRGLHYVVAWDLANGNPCLYLGKAGKGNIREFLKAVGESELGPREVFLGYESLKLVESGNLEILAYVITGFKLLHVLAESDGTYTQFHTTKPGETLGDARKAFENYQWLTEISPATASEFKLLITALEEKRRDDREDWENQPDNINKTKGQLLEEFNAHNLSIVDVLARSWNQILAQAGLEFDPQHAHIPKYMDKVFSWKPSLIANPSKELNYAELSTGMVNYIFRLGHIIAALHDKQVKSGILLVDEPENSLFPDFLFTLMKAYETIVEGKNVQSFFATHNPIVAAQFEPYERVILEWDEKGGVQAHKGVAPAGDDPNDVLHQDFGLTNLMGPAGIRKWKEYLEMKQELRRTEDPGRKDLLIEKILEIGRIYNFPA